MVAKVIQQLGSRLVEEPVKIGGKVATLDELVLPSLAPVRTGI
jgi:hypothetical protein